MMYVIDHECDLSEMPSHWNRWWAHVLPADLRTLYVRLCRTEYAEATTPLSDAILAKQAGRSKSKLYQQLRDLQEMKFLNVFYDEEEHLTYITVSPPPVPTSADEARANVPGESIKENEYRVADEFVKIWKRNWERTFGEAYVAPEAWDMAQAKRLIRLEPDLKHIRGVIQFYWTFAHDGEHLTFAGFVRDYGDYAAQKSSLDKGLH